MRGVRRKGFFFIFSAKIGARRPSKRGVRRKSFFIYFGVRMGMREPLERSGSVFWLILSQFRVGNCLNGTNRVREKFFLASQFRVREKFYFISVTAGGGRAAFIYICRQN